jgi:drug/metabolite transporter (DMT)-like permease
MTPNHPFLRHRDILQLLFGAFLISFSGVWVKLADVPPTTSAFYRVFLGFIFLLIACLWRRDYMRPTAGRLALIVLCGLFFALDLFCWHASIGYIGPGLATILGNFQVFILATTGVLLFGEHIRARFLLAIPLALSGLFLVVGINWNELSADYRSGVYLGLATAVCYSGFLLTLRKIQAEGRSYSFFFALMLISLSSSVFLGGQMLVAGDSFVIPDIKSLLSLVNLGLFSQTVGWALIANAMPRTRASFTGLILLVQPSLAFVWDVLLFRRPTDLLNWAGVIITLTAIYLGLTGSRGKD